MKLKFKISKLANYHFFIDNLSERKPYMRHQYNYAWLKEVGPLTPQEIKALKEWSTLCNQIEQQKKLKEFIQYFYKYNTLSLALNRIIKDFDKKTAKITKGAFQVFNKKFEIIWSNSNIILRKNKAFLERDFKNVRANLNYDLVVLKNLYQVKTIPSSINVFLILAPLIYGQGGRSINATTIAVEFNLLSPNNNEQLEKAWHLVLHELTHSLFESQQYKAKIKNYIKSKKDLNFPIAKKLNLSEVMRECIMQSFLIFLNPNGLRNKGDIYKVINKKYFQEKIQDKNALKKALFKIDFIKNFTAWKLKKTSQTYISQQKSIDAYFIKRTFDILRYYPNNLLHL